MAHNKDWREWLESLNASGVEYVVVGGIALAFHGIVRYTGDLDVLVHAGAVVGDYVGDDDAPKPNFCASRNPPPQTCNQLRFDSVPGSCVLIESTRPTSTYSSRS